MECTPYVRRQIKVSSGISAHAPLYANRPLNCFYYKGRVLIISAIKAINSDRPQELCTRASTRCVKNRTAFKQVPSWKGDGRSSFSKGEILFLRHIPGQCVKLVPFYLLIKGNCLRDRLCDRHYISKRNAFNARETYPSISIPHSARHRINITSMYYTSRPTRVIYSITPRFSYRTF